MTIQCASMTASNLVCAVLDLCTQADARQYSNYLFVYINTDLITFVSKFRVIHIQILEAAPLARFMHINIAQAHSVIVTRVPHYTSTYIS